MSLILVWAIVVAVALVLEFITMEMVSIWCAAGGIIALVLAAIGGISWEIQLIVFIATSIVFVLCFRKIALRFINKNSDNKNAEVLYGKTCTLLDDIGPNKEATVKLNGVVWTAVSEKVIKKGKEVVIVEVNGNKLKVKEKGDK